MANVNDKVVLALIGAGGRGTQVILSIQRCAPGVEVKYVCEVDQERGGRAIEELYKQQGVRPHRIDDMRYAFDDRDVDGVMICTPEHWHALGTVWACQGGKDVYVEKNISLTIPEGRKMIEASRKYNRIVQCGYQNRSAAYNISARDYIQSGKLGKIVSVKVYCMLSGHRSFPLREDTEVPEGLDWDQWLGPAAKVPYNLTRHKSYNDFWDYSCGLPLADGCHAMDLARMVLGDPDHPRSAFCAGGRVLFDDTRDIPDNQTITYDFGDFPYIMEASQYGGYMTKVSPEQRFGDSYPNWPFNSTRMEIYGTNGMMYLGRHGAGWQVYGKDSEILDQEHGFFPDEMHQQDFINSIRTRNTPTSDIEEGHKSATLVHLANLSYRTGKKQLFFDGEKEIVTNSEQANIISAGNNRSPYHIPQVI